MAGTQSPGLRGGCPACDTTQGPRQEQTCPHPAALPAASRAPAVVTGDRTGGIWAVTVTGELPWPPRTGCSEKSGGLSGAPQPRVVMVAGAAWRGVRTLLVARFGGHVPQEMPGTSLVAEQSVGHWQCTGSFVTALAVGQQERGCPLGLSPGRWGSLALAWP